MKPETILGYNFILIKELGNVWLPAPFVCSIQGDELLHYLKKGTPDVLSSYGIEIAESPHQTLIDICTKLSIVALQEKYTKGLKKKPTYLVL